MFAVLSCISFTSSRMSLVTAEPAYAAVYNTTVALVHDSLYGGRVE